MKIALISDSHDNVANLEKLIDWLNKNQISVLIHAGDLCAPGVLIRTLSPNYQGQIHLILGNVGDPVLLEKIAAQLSNVKYYGQKGEIEIENKKIAFVHLKEEAEKLAAENKYDFVVFGHTHQPRIQKTQINADQNTDKRRHISVNWRSNLPKSALMVNPGTLGGLYNRPTFAIYDTEAETIEIKEL